MDWVEVESMRHFLKLWTKAKIRQAVNNGRISRSSWTSSSCPGSLIYLVFVPAMLLTDKTKPLW